MKKYRLFSAISLMAVLLLSACSQDELAEQGTVLPEGEYPLQISGVTIDVESSSEPWSAKAPQTRVSESTDGQSSVWEGNEQIGVQIRSGQPGIYTVQADGSVTADEPAYWQSTEPTYITAWYPVEEDIDLSDQTERLAYVLQATQDPVSYDEQPVTLNFNHKLAKVRVLLDGSQAEDVTNVEVYNYTQCRHILGTIVTSDTEKGWIQMKKQEYADGTVCYEANVIPSEVIDHVKVNGIETTLTTSLTPVVAALNTIELTAGEPVTKITEDNCNNISGTDNYIVRDNFGQTITVTGGSPTIYIENANINVGSGNAISIEGGSATIHVLGNSNNVSSNDGAGIYVAENSSVTITGNNQDDKLIVKGGNGSAGIGGYKTGTTTAVKCGNIEITKVRIDAYGSADDLGNLAPAIGGAGSESCGTITIDDATVYAYGHSGSYSSSAIGAGFSMLEIKGTFQTITIRNNSEVSVQRGDSYCDYIGYSGFQSEPSTGDIIATIDNTSTVIKLN